MHSAFPPSGAPKRSDDYASVDESPAAGAAVFNSSLNYSDNVVFHKAQGHGEAAEKMNHLHDVYARQDAQHVGSDNAKNGADRLVNGQAIQTKYCQSGAKCIDACFDESGFRYFADGKPMQIEVPSDMHEAAVEAMKKRIARGDIQGITDPQLAEEIVRKGHYTYAQAKNVARAGTIESLTYDAVNGLQLAGTAMGLFAAISFATSIWNGENWKTALDAACFEGMSVGGIAWIGSILSAQAGRTGLEHSLRGTTDWVVKQMGSKVTAWLANSLRTGKDIYGSAATSYLSKVLRGNVVTGLVTTAVLSTDDFINLFTSRSSGKQTFKNIAKTGAAVGGGTAGWLGGAAVGSSLGSVVPFVGTAVGAVIGGVIGGALGGTAVNKAASTVLDHFIEEDAQKMMGIVKSKFALLATDFLLSQTEADLVIAQFLEFGLEDLLKRMHASDSHEEYAEALLMPLIKEQVAARPRIKLPSDSQMLVAATDLLNRIFDAAENADANATFEVERTTSEPPEASAPPSCTVAPIQKIRDLDHFVGEYEQHLNDGSSVYVGWDLVDAKAAKKIKAAEQSYANDGSQYKGPPRGGLVALVDTTIFGSGKDGIYLTTDAIYIKPYLEDSFFVLLKDIQTMQVFEDRCVIRINGKESKYIGKELGPRLKIFAKCINQYVRQFSHASEGKAS